MPTGESAQVVQGGHKIQVTKRHSTHGTEVNLPYLDSHSWHQFQTHPRSPQHCPRWAPWRGTHRRACQASVLGRSPLHHLPGHSSGWGWGTSWDLMLIGLYRQGKRVCISVNSNQKILEYSSWRAISLETHTDTKHILLGKETHWKFLIGTLVPLTICLFLNFQGYSLSCHLQQVDGFTQRLSLQAAAIDGQDSISDVDRSSPGTPDRGREGR